ncbi:HAD family hydrolase [Planomicrobium sp. CPCC 101079]|uniref:HAD family hydrolase n=1 Tax=Planomicrobium sp. CPCC 101079 TaxID=2599618 RepID=UPI0011B4AD4A|nr:HAD family hydrolase [Planomicrobium sp. CPCC 101079]TWT13279.1 HAD family hydrolase [Planomicrobium sp. CPCC 101079]
MDWLKDINVLIFDMDGTLYQDYSFMGRYIQKMMQANHTESEIQQTVALAYDILEGKKSIKLGFLYDPKELIFYSHNDLNPVISYNWDGIEIEMAQRGDGPLAYIGDPWGIAHLMGIKNNIAEETMKKAFEDVRAEMLMAAYCIIKRTDLFDEIKKLENKKAILMTNSPLPTGQEFVDFLEIGDVFDEYYFNGKKPHGIQALMDKLFDEGYQPQEILSIGDHPWNDLYPIHKAGGHTCLISQYEHNDATRWSASVKTIDELVDIVRQLNEATITAN